MALSLSQTDSDTGAITTYVRIDDANLSLKSGVGTFAVGQYVSQTTAATLRPLRLLSITLTPDEAALLRTQGLALLYGVLKARPEYSGALDA